MSDKRNDSDSSPESELSSEASSVLTDIVDVDLEAGCTEPAFEPVAPPAAEPAEAEPAEAEPRLCEVPIAEEVGQASERTACDADAAPCSVQSQQLEETEPADQAASPGAAIATAEPAEQGQAADFQPLLSSPSPGGGSAQAAAAAAAADDGSESMILFEMEINLGPTRVERCVPNIPTARCAGLPHSSVNLLSAHQNPAVQPPSGSAPLLPMPGPCAPAAGSGSCAASQPKPLPRSSVRSTACLPASPPRFRSA